MTPRTDWKEELAADEALRFETYAQQLTALQEKDSESGRPLRILHPKRHVGARATFTVLPDLPEHARVGIFAQPGTYQAWARYSNASHQRQTDQKADLRGFALKLLGVPGQKLIPGMESARTQDFLTVHTPLQAFRNADEFVFFVLAATQPVTLLPRLLMRFGVRRTIGILRNLTSLQQKSPSLAGQRFWSLAPIKWGAYAAKYQLLPVAPNDPAAPSAPSADYLREDLIARLARGSIEYDFAAQFYCDPAKTPIEDSSVAWSEDVAPLVRLARITVLQQDLRTDEGQRQQEYVESLSFDPWHAPVEFRPLGNIQRARNHAYRVSTMSRGAAKEPEGSEATVPDHSRMAG